MLASKILIKMSGSIAAYKVCSLISQLRQEGHEVQVVCTANTLHFIGRSTIEGLTGRALITDTFTQGRPMDHIDLDRWADKVLLAPATANTLNKLAAGIADDIIGTLFLAHDMKKPYLIAPAMNSKMYLHPSVQNSLQKLSAWGAQILKTDSGILACGESGPGRLLDVESIHLALTNSKLDKLNLSGNLLITSGGTQEPIDGVRSITNFSTGQTGAALTDAFVQLGYKVTLLRAQSAKRPQTVTHQHRSLLYEIEFTDFKSLEKHLMAELSKNSFDAVIHCAAVSDFSLDKVSSEKISSEQNLTLKLKPNSKLVHFLKTWSKNPQICVIAFKLTKTSDLSRRDEAIRKLITHPAVDYVVHNDLNEIKDTNHVFRIYNLQDKLAQCSTKDQLSKKLVDLISERGLGK